MNFIANIVIEAKTPLKVGSSDIDIYMDSPVQKDWNSLPMILGSSIAGALRSKFSKNENLYDLFGDDVDEQIDKKEAISNKKLSSKEKEIIFESLKGSRLVISNALLCDENMRVCETLLLEKSEFLSKFDELIFRNHNRINKKGVVDEAAKFDEEVVFKGSRFKFRLEIIDGSKNELKDIITILKSSDFRLGGGATKGFGDIEIIDELSSWDEFEINSDEYRKTSSSLNQTLNKKLTELNLDGKLNSLEKSSLNLIKYTLKLKPDNFFMFGSGFGDEEADMTPVYEKVIVYENNKGKFSKFKTLIPASSIKGAISHRSVYHLNLLKAKFIEDGDVRDNLDTIFGYEKDSKTSSDKKPDGKKGNILMSDLFIEVKDEKIFDHVAIDRFSGGAIDGALFQEKTTHYDKELKIEILLFDDVCEDEKNAFENALNDICNAMLPLGGTTTKGHGFFNGTLERNGEVITQKGRINVW